MLPGWYGFGAAVKAWVAAHSVDGMSILQAMYREWPFFQTTLSNMDMVLAKSDIAIASRYAELVPERELRDQIFQRCARSGSHRLTCCSPSPARRRYSRKIRCLARSIRNRFPYLDPLNHVQIELLKRYRAGDADERVVQGIHLTINGIAAGLRNSG